MCFQGPLGPALSFLVSMLGRAGPSLVPQLCATKHHSPRRLPGRTICRALDSRWIVSANHPHPTAAACPQGGSGFGFVGGLVSRWRTDVAEALQLSRQYPLLIEVSGHNTPRS